MTKMDETTLTRKLDETRAMRDALRHMIAIGRATGEVEIAPMFFVPLDEALKALRALDSKVSRYLSALGFESTRCSMDCLGAVSDVEDCTCQCQGEGHGKWNQVRGS